MSNSKNTDIKENYLKSFLFDKTRIKWYMFAILFYPALYTFNYVLGNLFILETSEFFFNPDPYIILAFLLTFFFTGGPEEFGWRGFLQKELQKKYNPLITVLIIGFVWALWHLPLHYNGFYPPEYTFSSHFLIIFQLTILFLWLYNKSGYSILAVIILHALNNNADRIFGASYIPAMVVAVILVIIFIFDNKMWKRKNYAKEIYS
jgi:membrane protease YdiL (CAAX protease family)